MLERLGEFCFAAGARIDHASRDLALERAVQARLVARDAGVDLGLAALDRLGDDVAVGEPGARHRNKVRAAVGQHLLGHLRHVDAVGGHQRHAHLAHELLGHPGESRARHHGGDRGDAGLVPTDARVDDVGAGGLDDLRLLHHLAPAVALLHEVEHAQAVHDGKVGAAGLADAGNDLLWKAHPVGEVAAPSVGPVVGSAHQELVDEVAFGAHDLHAIVASFAGQHRAAHVGADGPLHAPSTERPRAELADGRLALGGCDAERMVAVSAAVQNLQGNAAIGCVHGIGHLPVLARLAERIRARSVGRELACAVGADAACDDEPSATLGPLGIELGELGESALSPPRGPCAWSP